MSDLALALTVWGSTAGATLALIAYGQWRHPERFTREAAERRWAASKSTTESTTESE